MWYHFEKFVQGHLSAEIFRELPNTLTKDELKDLAEDWSEHVNDDGSRWAGWSTQWRKVESPPDDWILDQMQYHAKREQYHRGMLMELNKIENPPVTKYGVKYFDDNKKEWILFEVTFNSMDSAQKMRDDLKEIHLKENRESKGKIHKYLHKAIKLRSIKYLDNDN